jgi:hypothetical protein
MARNRRAALRRLTVEQESFLLVGNLLTRAQRDESDADAERRLFGSRGAAADAWHGHRDELLAADPVCGRRPYGWWRYQRADDVPPVAFQPDLLRQLGELSQLEEATLEQWRRMTPEPPADLALDHQSTTERRPPLLAILEEPHADDVDATPGETWPAVTEADAGSDAPSEDREAEATAEERNEEGVVMLPPALHVPWYRANEGPSPNQGWE